jgi:hypothetical protein
MVPIKVSATNAVSVFVGGVIFHLGWNVGGWIWMKLLH